MRPPVPPVPHREIDAVFLDAGHTVLCWDEAFASTLLAAHGIEAAPAAIARAEAAARPVFSNWLARGASTEALEARAAYVQTVLLRLAPELQQRSAAERHTIVSGVVASMRTPEAQDRLWSRVPEALPGALAELRAAGLRLVIVSNSDGTVAAKLATAGILDLFDGVVDSHLVGVEKPDAAIFAHALALSRTRAERTLHVGDLHAIDVVGARRAGLHAVLLDPFDDWSDADCERANDVATLATRILRARSGAEEDVR